jgi:hypothetical protein
VSRNEVRIVYFKKYNRKSMEAKYGLRTMQMEKKEIYLDLVCH